MNYDKAGLIARILFSTDLQQVIRVYSIQVIGRLLPECCALFKYTQAPHDIRLAEELYDELRKIAESELAEALVMAHASPCHTDPSA